MTKRLHISRSVIVGNDESTGRGKGVEQLTEDNGELAETMSAYMFIAGRILLDIPCKVCNDHSSGKHYGQRLFINIGYIAYYEF